MMKLDLIEFFKFSMVVSALLFLAAMLALTGCAYKGNVFLNSRDCGGRVDATTEVPISDVANGNTVPLGAL